MFMFSVYSPPHTTTHWVFLSQCPQAHHSWERSMVMSKMMMSKLL